MKAGESLFGFNVLSSEYVKEAEGTLWELRHGKAGTRLVFLERPDRNKSFYIAFKTLPQDDTGVFHIIEHSVLCGSRKFPVKEPFVELLKSSLKTFLNAMTYPDKTVYPVSSRSDKDFLNLVDIYMDAVFHPLMLENESIFMQEGHRYEWNGGDAPLSVNGVVYNEMKGAMSSPDEISGQELMTLLYPEGVYGKNSGGDPDAIRTLSYEEFREAHKKYYHPSSAMIFLDGEVRLDEILPLLDSYLSEAEDEGEHIEIGDDCEVIPTEKTVEYEISAEENEAASTRFYLGVRTFDYKDTESALMLSVLSDAIAGTNESPLTRAFLEAELCEDVSVFPLGDGIKYRSYAIELKNASCTAERAYSFLFDTLKRIAHDGIGRGRLEASLNSREFKLREKDFGSLPTGLVFGLSLLDTWLYGSEPSFGLKYEDALASVRKKLDTGAFEQMLTDIFVNNERSVRLTMLPSRTLGEKRTAAEDAALEKIKDSMSAAELDLLEKKNRAFAEWQSTPDREEDLAKLPYLSISDIPREGTWTPTEAFSVGGRDVLVHEISTGGITYAELLFDISDLEPQELSLATFVASVLGKCRTEKYTKEELEQTVKTHLGSFAASTTVITSHGVPTPFLYITASALDSERESLLNTVGEIINSTDLTDARTVKSILTQSLISHRESLICAGHSAAVRRSRAYVSTSGALAENLLGLEMYKRLKSAVALFETESAAFTARLTAIFKKIVTRVRLTAAITGEADEKFIRALAALPRTEGAPILPCIIPPLGRLNEGIVIPSRVAYVSRSASLSDIGEDFTGSMHVISGILSYTHLWNSVRVKGGAYGAGFSVRRSGIASMYSYRDPNPAASVRACDGSGEFLRSLAKRGESLDSYVIGTFGDYDSLSSARSAGADATVLYMMGVSKDDEMKVRESMLGFGKSELLRLADITDRLMESSGICVVGSSEQIDSCGDILKTKTEI